MASTFKNAYALLLCVLVGYSQKSLISLSAGYLIDIDQTDSQIGQGNGWRVIGTYQGTLKNEKWAIGISAGLIEDRFVQYYFAPNSETETVIRTVPIYVSGKYFVGKKDWKGYLKGSAGLNIQTNSIDTKAKFLTGLGLGVDYHLNSKLLLNTEYELILLDTEFYGGRLLHSFNLGIGYKF